MVNKNLGNIFVFMVMFCFSCSISFADTEKSDVSKEKRYQERKKEFEKADEDYNFRQRYMEEKAAKLGKQYDNALADGYQRTKKLHEMAEIESKNYSLDELQAEYQEKECGWAFKKPTTEEAMRCGQLITMIHIKVEEKQKAKQEEKAAPILPLQPVQSVDSLVAELNGLLNFKTNRDLPYIPITNEQKNEITNLGFNKTHPSEEIAELVRNTVDDSFEKIGRGTSYELYHRDSINELLPTTIKSGVGLVHSNIVSGAMVWSNLHTGPVAVLVTITSGAHKGEMVFIPASEYGSNLKQGKRITVN